MNFIKKNQIHFIAVGLFILASLIFSFPAFQGKLLAQQRLPLLVVFFQ